MQALPNFTLVLAAVAFFAATPALAVPPTVTPSPGYDARLAEQRRAAREQLPVIIDRRAPRKPAVRYKKQH